MSQIRAVKTPQKATFWHGWLKSIILLWYSRNNFTMGRFLNKCSKEKNGEALESFMGIWPSRRNFPEFQMGEILKWRVIISAHNLAVVQTMRRKLHITLNNIFTVLTLTGIEIRTPKSLNIQSVMSTFPLYQRGALQNNV